MFGVDTQDPENLFFFVATVPTGVDADGGEFATFAPAFDGKGGDTKKVSDFTDGEKIRKIFEIDFFCHIIFLKLMLAIVRVIVNRIGFVYVTIVLSW